MPAVRNPVVDREAEPEALIYLHVAEQGEGMYSNASTD